MSNPTHPMCPMHAFARYTAFAGALFAGATVFAQEATPEPPPPDLDEKAVVLSPFVVNVDEDSGYAARNTLAGSRFKTDLKDTAASISVLTAEFISDLGANSLEEALQYSVSAQPELGDSTEDGSNPNGNAVQGGPPEFRVRGQKASRARNYFTLHIATDNYNVERIEDSRGPNSVLFGFGAPGGIISVSTKQARTDRSFRKATFQTGSFGSHRETIDLNQVLMKGKLALRLNAVYEKAGKFQEYAFNRDRRFDLALKYQILPTLEFRAQYERGLIRENKPRPFAMLDAHHAWQSLGSQLYPTTQGSSAALGITRLGSGRRLTYIGNDGSLVEAGQTLVTRNTNIAILDRSIADPSINYGGPGQINDTTANNFTAFLEKKLGQRTFVELAYNHQDQSVERYNPGQTNMVLWGDPSQNRRNSTSSIADDPANPFAGRLFIENSSNAWERNTSYVTSDLLRATVSTEFDAGKWGNYRIAALAEHDSRENEATSQREAWEGRPFNSAPENAANQVRRRNYVTPGDWSTYYINSPVTTGLITGATDPITGQTLNSTWVARSQSQEDDPATQTSALISAQARFFNGKLVVGAGYRYDKLEITDRTAQRDPVTNEWSRAFATEALVEREARNTSLGAVGHLTSNLSVFYNQANNQGLQGNQRIIDTNNLLDIVAAPNSEGKGKDYGVMLSLFDNRLNARLTRYNTDSVNQSASFGVTGVGPNSVAKNIMGALHGAGLVSATERDRHTTNQSGVLYDVVSSGYEFELTANLLKGWRLQANYSYTDTQQANFGPEIRAWMEQEVAYWRSFNQGNLVTGQENRTIDEAIAFMYDGFEFQSDIGDLGEQGLRKHKVSLFSRYEFQEGFLKGAYAGGGYRHQSKNLAGASGLTGFYGKSFWRADMVFGYTFRKSTIRRTRFLDGLTLQLNIANVFDDTDPLITRIEPDGFSVRRAIVQVPRTWRLSAKMDF